MKLLSVNAGSSSLKFRVYEMPEEKVLMKGLFERIGLDGSCYDLRIGEAKVQKEAEIKSHEDAVNILIEELLKEKIVKDLSEIKAVGHRVVHGGSSYSGSVEITARTLIDIEELFDLAPLHNPACLMGIKAFLKAIPDAKEVACFDTAFHQTMSESAYLYPVPYDWYTEYNVRKYGFHGLSHQYITNTMQDMLGKKNVNLIICHIGSGASITAVRDGKCIDTSMGFTPNAGIVMGTRSGDIDYSIIEYMMKKTGKSIREIDTVLNKQSGLYGITGMSDLRDLDSAFLAKEEKALLAFDIYTGKIVDYIASYYMKLGKVDAICFTAGGGENDSIIRGETIKKLSPLGVKLDAEKNEETVVRKGKEGIITTEDSSIPAYVVATDEELMIARDTFKIVK